MDLCCFDLPLSLTVPWHDLADKRLCPQSNTPLYRNRQAAMKFSRSRRISASFRNETGRPEAARPCPHQPPLGLCLNTIPNPIPISARLVHEREKDSGGTPAIGPMKDPATARRKASADRPIKAFAKFSICFLRETAKVRQETTCLERHYTRYRHFFKR